MHAVFLDRDGVINRERADYVKSWQEFAFLPDALPALARLARLSCPIVVVTNQSAIGRGLTSDAAVADIHRRMCTAVAAAGGRIDAVYVCPHRPDAGCACRKPRPGLLQQAAADLGLVLTECLLIGDSISDLQAAHAVGAAALLVRSGRQGPQLAALIAAEVKRHASLTGVPLLPTLAEAVDLLLAQADGRPPPY